MRKVIALLLVVSLFSGCGKVASLMGKPQAPKPPVVGDVVREGHVKYEVEFKPQTWGQASAQFLKASCASMVGSSIPAVILYFLIK
jgi:uncharacterized protein YceK